MNQNNQLTVGERNMNNEQIKMNERIAEFNKMFNSIKFDNNIYIIGKGAIGTILLHVITKFIIMDKKKIHVIDGKDRGQIMKELKETINEYVVEIELINEYVKQDNYKRIFSKLKKDDIIIDCSIDVCTMDIIKLCQDVGSSYINSSIETWDYKEEKDPYKYSLYYKYKEAKKYSSLINVKKFNAILGFGCNPGMVSIWAKKGLDLINKHYGNNNKIIHYGKTAKDLGLHVIHISEKDTQRTNNPKTYNEYCNTWSTTMEPFYQESLAPIEMTWGTHEENPEKIEKVSKYIENDRYVVFDKLCIETFAKSYTPISKNYIGRLIRHEENLTIGDTFSIYENDKRIYCPSVYYVYHPTNDTMMSLNELKERNYIYQDKYRLLTKEIIDGADELGLTFFMENGDIFWVGSLLNIDESRKLFDNKLNNYINATIIQVIGGYLSGLFHIINNINNNIYEGVLSPDDIPHEKIFDTMKSFYGKFVCIQVTDWNYSQANKIKYFSEFGISEDQNIKNKKKWTFDQFLV